MTKVNMDGVEAWSGGVILPPGEHHVEIDDANERTSAKNNPQVEVEMRAVGGANDGGKIRDWITLTPAAFGRVRQFLEATGFPIPAGEFEMPVGELVGRQCKIIVREKAKPDGTKVSEVVAYEHPGSDVPAASATAVAAKSDADALPF